MKAGDSFGERALIKHEARAATVYCSQNCIFATLSRYDYIKIIGQAKKKELK
jgi:CRP-like cAMP-binding protein